MAVVYIASKVKYAPAWRYLRSLGININSTWIDEAGKGQTASFADLWDRCVNEVKASSHLILFQPYPERDVLKGAFVELGVALGHGIPITFVGRPNMYTFQHHRLITTVPELRQAVLRAGFNRPPGFENFDINSPMIHPLYAP